jgi:hypothetical protein
LKNIFQAQAMSLWVTKLGGKYGLEFIAKKIRWVEMIFKTREAWLEAAIKEISPLLANAG